MTTKTARTETLTVLAIKTPDRVDIQFSDDGQTLWVNIDDVCRLRVSGLAVVAARHALYTKLGDHK